MKLTERKVEQLSPEPGRKDRLAFDDAQRGLAVRVTASGGRTYLCQYTIHGHKWRVPLGSCAAVSLAKAREAAASVMGDVAKGRNPAAERKAAAAAERARRARNRLTLRVLIEGWKRVHLAARRPSYAAEAVRALHYAFADYLDEPAEDLDRADIVRALEALTRRRRLRNGEAMGKRNGAAMIGRTAAYGRAAFAWAIRRGSVGANPFAALPVVKGAAKRERVLSDAEVAEVWQAAREASVPFGPIIRLLILTGQRRGEVAGMAWSELSNDLTMWSLPAERTKNGTAHNVSLSDPVRSLLKPFMCNDAGERHASGQLVFPGVSGTPFAGWSKAKAALDKAIMATRTKAAETGGKAPAPLTPSWNVHDLRRTVATGLQRLGVRLEVTEAILNHISGSRGGIAGVYQRHDWASEKRAALDAWATHVRSIVEGSIGGTNVVKMPHTA